MNFDVKVPLQVQIYVSKSKGQCHCDDLLHFMQNYVNYLTLLHLEQV